MATHKSSLGDKQAALPKISKHFKRVYGSVPKPMNLPVLETLLFGICLEDVEYDRAKKAFDRLKDAYLDWNEVRVTTVSELEKILDGLPDNAIRAVRVRHLLMYIYDHQYSYDFEALKKKTQELVHRQLSRIKHMTPFARNYATQQALGAHVIPLDRRMLLVAVWLGLVPAGALEDEGSDLLKGMIRKAESAEFFYWLKSFSNSKVAVKAITEEVVLKPNVEWDVHDAAKRVEDLLANEKTKIETAKPESEKESKEVAPKAKGDHKPVEKFESKSDKHETKSAEKTEVKSDSKGDKKAVVAKKPEAEVRKPARDDAKSQVTVKKRSH